MKGLTSAYLSGDERVRLAVFNSITDRHTVMGVESSHSFCLTHCSTLCSSVTHIVSSFPLDPSSFIQALQAWFKKNVKKNEKRQGGCNALHREVAVGWAKRSLLQHSAGDTHTRSTHALTDLLKHSHTENLEMESRNGGQDLWFSFNLIWFLPSHLSPFVRQHYNFMPTEDLSHSFFFFLNVTVPSESKPQVTSLPS